MWGLAEKYGELDTEAQSECNPYAVWKTGFLAHIVLFFLSMSFALGTCDTFLNEEDREIELANNEQEREYMTRLIEKSIHVLKYNCMVFCGPFILVECILSCVYYD